MSFQSDMREALGESRFEAYFCPCSMKIEGRAIFVSSQVAAYVLNQHAPILDDHGMSVAFAPELDWPPCPAPPMTQDERDEAAARLRRVSASIGRG